MKRVLGIEPELPDGYKDFYEKKERYEVMGPDDVKKAKEFIMGIIGI